MLEIAVCDDSAEIRKQLREYLRKFSDSSGIELSLREYASPSDFLKEDYSTLSLLITDIQMPVMSGLEMAREIRKSGSEVTIIFFTNYIQYALEGYEVQAFRFLLKPLTYEQFASVVGEALLRLQSRKKAMISVLGKEQTSRVSVDEIQYVETEKGHVRIHTPQGTLVSSATMKEMEDTLREHGFFRCHSAYLVPLQGIRSVDLTDVTLQNGEKIPLSKHRKKELREAITLFWGGKFL